MTGRQWWRTRTAAYALIVLVAIGVVAALSVRREAAGADAFAYWYWTRQWLLGADPYQLHGAALPYVYAPWALPFFAPWAVLPWAAALAVWRGGTVVVLSLSAVWAAQQAPRSTALWLAALAIPIGINLDTGNITLPIALALFWTLVLDERWAGIVWGAATGLKWITLPLFLLLPGRGRITGMAALAAGIAASLLLWPATLEQVRTLLAVDRPIPWDYLVLAWPLTVILVRRGFTLDRWLERHPRLAQVEAEVQGPA